MWYLEDEDIDEDYDFENEDIVIEDYTWEKIRKRAAETDEDPKILAERFIEELKELRAERPEIEKAERRAWIRVADYRKKQKKSGINQDDEQGEPEVVRELNRLHNIIMQTRRSNDLEEISSNGLDEYANKNELKEAV